MSKRYLKTCGCCGKETLSWITRPSGIWCKSCFETKPREFAEQVAAAKAMMDWRSRTGAMLSMDYYGSDETQAHFCQSFSNGLGTWLPNASQARKENCKLSNQGIDKWLEKRVEDGTIKDPYFKLEGINKNWKVDIYVSGCRPAPRYEAPQSIDKL